MTAALPAALTYGTVRWWVVGAAEDSADPGKEPDTELIQGTVTFRPVVEGAIKFIGTAEEPQPVTVLPRAYTYSIVNGILVNSDGSPDIKLVACDSPATSPQEWQYLVEYQLEDGYTFGSFRFRLHTDEVVDLTLKVPETAADGVVYVTGPEGRAATVEVGIVTTGAPGSSASVINTGTALDAVLDFSIPRGDVGPQGPEGPQGPQGIQGVQGVQGPAGTVAVGSTTTGPPGSAAAVGNTGTPENAVLDFTIPRGDKGDQGIQGDPGTAATIAVGTVDTVAPGSPATVTNVGTSGAAVFDFEIPKGDPGTGSVSTVNGDPGPDVVLGAADVGAAPTMHTHGAADISDSTATGRSVLTAVDAAAARTAIGAGTYTAAAATTAAQGLVELATNAEVQTGSDTTRAVTPAGLASRTATETRTGVVELATTAETTAGVDTARAVTPAGVKAVGDTKAAAVSTGAGLWIGTQAAYDALGSYSATTLYAIVG